MKKLLFVSTYNSPSVRRDFNILRKHFSSRVLYFPDVNKNPITVAKYFLQILINVYWADVCFVRFADFRAFLVIILCKIFGKSNALAIGGYEVANEPEFNYGALQTRDGRRRIKYMISHADIVIANSEFSKKEIQLLRPQMNVLVINHGIKEVQKSDAIHHKEDLIVTIGNLKKDIYKLKGIDTFAEAAAKLGVKAVIIGAYDKKIYDKFKSKYPDIELTGYLPQNEIKAILNKTKVYCQLSYRESFGVALLEAMSFGCIPVVTKRSALPEVVGNVGFYTEFGDIEMTSNAISKALNSNNYEAVVKRVNNKLLLKYREEKLLKLLSDNKWI